MLETITGLNGPAASQLAQQVFFAGPKPLVKSFHEQRLEELRKGKQKLSAPL